MDKTLKGIVAGLVGWWVTTPVTIQILMSLMCADIATGILAAYVQQRIDSSVSWRGMAKKLMMLIMVTLCHVGATHTKELGFQLPLDLGSCAAVFYSINEMISIVENFVWAGVPVPDAIVQALAKAKGGAKGGNEKR